MGQSTHSLGLPAPVRPREADVTRVPAARRRELLAAAAVRVLARDGLAAVTTRAVVAEAGMKLASFHYAYDSRAELLRDLVEGVVAGERDSARGGLLEAVVRRPVAPEAPPRSDVDHAADVTAVIHACLRAYLELVAQEPGREQGMFELTQHALRDPALSGVARDQYAHYHELAAELLGLLGDQLGLEWDAPVADLARLLVGLTDGLTLAWLADRDDAATDRMARLAAQMLAAHALAPHRVTV